ncbi:MFS transporter [Streptomyces sp. NBC_01411]|uniref:MFS transporter n=1 Tax=Streptomyces sp. NBC_01411 TaxID=2903857 RepID=UPI00324DFC4C
MSTTTTHRGSWFALSALVLAMLTIGLDTTILNVALPEIATDLHMTSGQLQWTGSSYTLVLAALMIPAGGLGDRFGRKKLLIAALLLFGVASALCAVATTPALLIAGRCLLGAAAAFMMPLSLSVLPALFPDPAERARARTLQVTATAMGLPLGPILGGLLLSHFWWGSVFLVNLPLVALGAFAIARFVPESRSTVAHPVDLPGAALSAAGLTAVTYGFIQAGSHGWLSPDLWLPAAAGALLLAAFAGWQRRTSHPLIDLALFRSRTFNVGVLMATLSSFALFGLLYALPQYFQAVQGSSALATGLKLLPMLLGMTAGTRCAGRIARRTGDRPALTAGLLLAAAALAAGATTTVHTPYAVTALWTAALGTGVGMTLPLAMNSALGVLSTERAGSGSGLLQALRQAGGTIGIAILGTVLTSGYRGGVGVGHLPPRTAGAVRDSAASGVQIAHRSGSAALLDSTRGAFVHGMNDMLLTCSGIALVAALLALVLIPRHPRQDRAPAPRPRPTEASTADTGVQGPSGGALAPSSAPVHGRSGPV